MKIAAEEGKENFWQSASAKPRIIELKTAEEAQNAPSVYAAFNLIHKGRLLADRYISTTRFKNILNKELKK